MRSNGTVREKRWKNWGGLRRLLSSRNSHRPGERSGEETLVRLVRIYGSENQRGLWGPGLILCMMSSILNRRTCRWFPRSTALDLHTIPIEWVLIWHRGPFVLSSFSYVYLRWKKDIVYVTRFLQRSMSRGLSKSYRSSLWTPPWTPPWGHTSPSTATLRSETSKHKKKWIEKIRSEIDRTQLCQIYQERSSRLKNP